MALCFHHVFLFLSVDCTVVTLVLFDTIHMYRLEF
uniref:Uncharacterized protein n=1 Tax=Rhizophora mucronata TaxID=61149 RepID=A0A2P2J4F1_RHIMU